MTTTTESTNLLSTFLHYNSSDLKTQTMPNNSSFSSEFQEFAVPQLDRVVLALIHLGLGAGGIGLNHLAFVNLRKAPFTKCKTIKEISSCICIVGYSFGALNLVTSIW